MSSTKGGSKARKPRAAQGNTRAAKPAAARRALCPLPSRRQRIPAWCVKIVLAAFLLGLAIAAWAALDLKFAPTSNTDRTRFDALIVLGTPADEDGNPTPTQLARVNEAVREYERGVAPRIIMSGGAAHNPTVEAEVMARTAQAEGVPEGSILLEGKSLDTMQNLCYSTRLMRQHGWTSAEIVSTPSHLPRAALIAEELPIQWRTHAAPLLAPTSPGGSKLDNWSEELKTVRFLVWARLNERCEP
jgi:uncharacterized SAM-binding protein YcdF (DUF218 family)